VKAGTSTGTASVISQCKLVSERKRRSATPYMGFMAWEELHVFTLLTD